MLSVIPPFTDMHTHKYMCARCTVFYASVKQVYWLLQCDSQAASYTTVLLFPVPSLRTSSPPTELLPLSSLRPSVRSSSSPPSSNPGWLPTIPCCQPRCKTSPLPLSFPSKAPLSAPVGSAASVLACSSAASASELSSPTLSSLTLRSVPVGAQGRVKGSTQSCRGKKRGCADSSTGLPESECTLTLIDLFP